MNETVMESVALELRVLAQPSPASPEPLRAGDLTTAVDSLERMGNIRQQDFSVPINAPELQVNIVKDGFCMDNRSS